MHKRAAERMHRLRGPETVGGMNVLCTLRKLVPWGGAVSGAGRAAFCITVLTCYAIPLSPAAANDAGVETYMLDPSHTYPRWAASHFGFSTHHGQFNKTVGKLVKEACGAEVSGTIKRSEFGMKYGIPGIGDDARLTIQIEAIKD
jgi:polyisoprenoid-binding protein YceI